MKHLNLKLTNTRDAQASLGVLRQIHPSAVMTAHRLLSSAMGRNDDLGWPVHSLMLDFIDLHGLGTATTSPSTVPCNMIFAAYHGDRHGRAMITWND